jgi:hypothetical protein
MPQTQSLLYDRLRALQRSWRSCRSARRHAGKGIVVSVFKRYAMNAYAEWMYRSTFSSPWHWLAVSGQLDVPAALPPGKEPPVPIG